MALLLARSKPRDREKHFAFDFGERELPGFSLLFPVLADDSGVSSTGNLGGVGGRQG